jgi:hypothetical protein
MSEGVSPPPVMSSWCACGQLHGIFQLEVSGLLLHHLLIGSQHYFMEWLFITIFGARTKGITKEH